MIHKGVFRIVVWNFRISELTLTITRRLATALRYYDRYYLFTKNEKILDTLRFVLWCSNNNLKYTIIILLSPNMII